jgi:hypothetical protein
MNPYAASTSVQRSVGGKIWKGILVLTGVLVALVFASFFFCSGRLDREHYRSALEKARVAEDMNQLDLVLLPKFQKETLANGKARYTGRPVGTGVCGCAPALVDTVEVTYDGAGQVTKASFSQSLGWASRTP